MNEKDKKALQIILKKSTPKFDSKRYEKEATEIALHIDKAAKTAHKYGHIGTADWLYKLAKQMRQPLKLLPFNSKTLEGLKK